MSTSLETGVSLPAPVTVETSVKTRRDAALSWIRRKLVTPQAQENPSRRRLLFACLTIFLLAISVRLLYWQDMRVETLQEDSIATTLVRLYEQEAKRMEEDGGILFPSREVDKGDARMLVHPPGYAMLLRLLYGTEHPANHYFTLRLLQITVDALSVVLLLLIVAELLPFALAIIAASIAAISPHLGYYSLWLSPDSLVVLPILGGVYFFIKARQNPRLLFLIASGVWFGIACWLRSNPLLLAGYFAVFALFTFTQGKRWQSALTLVLAMAATIAPITIRNAVVFHRFIPLTIITGLNLVQGLAEFDKEGKFAMPAMDADAMAKDVEWHNRPDYGRNLFVPDGIERDQYRFERGIAVIRENPGWFMKGVVRRMAFMVRYNDFRPQNNDTFTSIAPPVASAPHFGHSLELPADAQSVWQASAAEIAEFEKHSPTAQTRLINSDRLHVRCGGIANEDQLSSPPITVKPYTDYILCIPYALQQGRAEIKVRALDRRYTLQSKLLFDDVRKKREWKHGNGESNAGDKTDEIAPPTENKPLQTSQIAFSSAANREVRFTISNTGDAPQTLLETGEAQLYEIGQTPYLWTRPLRSVIRGIQKNLFKTDVMRVLLLFGILLLLMARQSQTLFLLLLVPLYYLSTHAPFSTEVRYILPLHYCLFAVAATTIFLASTGIATGFQQLTKRRQIAREQPQTT
jgi:hypothetical protein